MIESHFGNQLRRIFACSALVVLFSACRTPKNFTYFKDIPDSAYKPIAITEFKEPVIQANDILQISILTMDPDENLRISSANAPIVSGALGEAGAPSQGAMQGFQVDARGGIEIPVIGKISVVGLTTAQARDTIHNRVALFYKEPVINVRFANFSVTVLGEVARPGKYIIPNEKASILDAIGMAGDLTIYGKRDNIIVMRDSAGSKLVSRFDLTSSKVLQSPFFYLKQGDVVYIEPNKAKIAASDASSTRNYALLASILTVIIVIISRI